MSNSYQISKEEIEFLEFFQNYSFDLFPKIIKKLKQSPSVVNDDVDVDVEPSLNPSMIKINEKDLELINDLMCSVGFDIVSNILTIHFLLMNPNNQFSNEEKLVDYLSEKGGLQIYQISDILKHYNSVKDRFSSGNVIDTIPLEYVDKRKNGIREYDGKGKKVLKWSGVHNGKEM